MDPTGRAICKGKRRLRRRLRTSGNGISNVDIQEGRDMTRQHDLRPTLTSCICLCCVIVFLISGCKKSEDNVTGPDTVAPTVAVSSPANNSIVIDSVVVLVNASDNVGVQKVEFYIDGNLVLTRAVPPWQYSWNVLSLSAGSIHTILAKAYDAAGNVGSSQTTIVTVQKSDKIAPTVTISTPIPNAVVTDSILVTATANDNVGVTKVEIYVDGALVSSLTASPWAFEWVVANLPLNSSHSLTARAYDASNNIGNSLAVPVTVTRSQSLHFGGSDYVTLPSSASLVNFGNQVTMEAWVKMDSYPSPGAGFNILSSGNENEYVLGLLASGKIGVTMDYINPQVNAMFIGKSSLLPNIWYHLAVVYDGSVESIYINGALDTSFVTAGGNVHVNRVDNISIGVYTWNNYANHNGYMVGLIDEVRVWNIGRTQNQIQTNMNKSLVGNESGLMGYWKFDGNAIDSSPNGNNGIITGSPTFVITNR